MQGPAGLATYVELGVGFFFAMDSPSSFMFSISLENGSKQSEIMAEKVVNPTKPSSYM